jgi:cobalt transporter subunit CbtB
MPLSKAPTWRDDIDALSFRPTGHRGLCMVHRHAFRTLLRTAPSPQDCIDFYRAHRDVLQAAATLKCFSMGIDMQQIETAHLPAFAADSSAIVQAVLAMFLGLFIVGIVGFSHISAIP